MRIIADANIPFVEQVFKTIGDVTLIPGRNIDRTVLEESDALLVRSITRVDKKLLEGTSVKFVGTADYWR